MHAAARLLALLLLIGGLTNTAEAQVVPNADVPQWCAECLGSTLAWESGGRYYYTVYLGQPCEPEHPDCIPCTFDTCWNSEMGWYGWPDPGDPCLTFNPCQGA